MMEAPTTPLALAWVAQALRRCGARKCVSGGAMAGEAAIASDSAGGGGILLMTTSGFKNGGRGFTAGGRPAGHRGGQISRF